MATSVFAGRVPAAASNAGLSVARGNGKSTLTAAIATAAIAGPLAQSRADVVCVASSFTQARIIFEHVIAFMRPWLEREPTRWRIQDSSNRGQPGGSADGCAGALSGQ